MTFSSCDPGTTRYLCAKKWTLYLMQYAKLTQNINVKYKITKLSKENIGEAHHDLRLGQKFLDTTPNA